MELFEDHAPETRAQIEVSAAVESSHRLADRAIHCVNPTGRSASATPNHVPIDIYISNSYDWGSYQDY